MPTFDIMHLSSVHSRIDTRIRYKQCVELARAYPGRVAFIVQDGDVDNKIKLLNEYVSQKQLGRKYFKANFMSNLAEFRGPQVGVEANGLKK